MKRILIALCASTIIGNASAEALLTMHIEEQTSWVRNFNPFDAAGRRQSTLDFIYEPLVIFNAYDNGKPIYRLATAYKFSDDLKSVTYTIRDGVKWSDGQPLTAKDVKFTFDLMMKNPSIDIVGVGAAVQSVELPAPNQVKVNLKDVDSQFPESLADFTVVPEHVWKGVGDPFAYKNENPVGSGPMTEIRRFTPQVYEQCRNPNYWDAEHLKVDCLKLPQISGNDQMLATLPEGNMDWFGSFLPEIEKTYVSLDPKHNGYWQPSANTVSFEMNLKTTNPGNKAAFDDIKFRQAVSLLMDRKSMVDIAGFGFKPVVRVIDDWNENRDLVLVAEARVGAGRLVLCAADLATDLGTRHVARSFRNGLAAALAGLDESLPEVSERALRAWWRRVSAEGGEFDDDARAARAFDRES